MSPPPRIEVCPICHLPGTSARRPNCPLFTRMCSPGEKKKWADSIEDSAKKRICALSKFHPDICEVCRLPSSDCKKAKIKIAIRRQEMAAPVQGPLGPYVPEIDLHEAIKDIECHPPNRKEYTPVIPTWFTKESQ